MVLVCFTACCGFLKEGSPGPAGWRDGQFPLENRGFQFAIKFTIDPRVKVNFNLSLLPPLSHREQRGDFSSSSKLAQIHQRRPLINRGTLCFCLAAINPRCRIRNQPTNQPPGRLPLCLKSLYLSPMQPRHKLHELSSGRCEDRPTRAVQISDLPIDLQLQLGSTRRSDTNATYDLLPFTLPGPYQGSPSVLESANRAKWRSRRRSEETAQAAAGGAGRLVVFLPAFLSACESLCVRACVLACVGVFARRGFQALLSEDEGSILFRFFQKKLNSVLWRYYESSRTQFFSSSRSPSGRVALRSSACLPACLPAGLPARVSSSALRSFFSKLRFCFGVLRSRWDRGNFPCLSPFTRQIFKLGTQSVSTINNCAQSLPGVRVVPTALSLSVPKSFEAKVQSKVRRALAKLGPGRRGGEGGRLEGPPRQARGRQTRLSAASRG